MEQGGTPAHSGVGTLWWSDENEKLPLARLWLLSLHPGGVQTVREQLPQDGDGGSNHSLISFSAKQRIISILRSKHAQAHLLLK